MRLAARSFGRHMGQRVSLSMTRLLGDPVHFIGHRLPHVVADPPQPPLQNLSSRRAALMTCLSVLRACYERSLGWLLLSGVIQRLKRPTGDSC